MHWLARIFAQAFARRIALVIVAALLAWAGIGRAEAACSGNSCDTKEEAYDKVLYKGSDFCPVYGVPNGVETATYVETDVTATSGRVTAYYKCDGSTVAQASATWASVCPVGQTWNPQTYKCETGCVGAYGEDPYNPGQCLDEDKCRARNTEMGFIGAGETSRSFSSACKGGCEFSRVEGTGYSTCADGVCVYSGVYEFSGAACSTDDGPPPEPDDGKDGECMQLPGQTVCLRPDGQHCYSASAGSGSGFCWKPGEVGEQNQGPDKQVRNPGPEVIPPNLNLNSGDTLQPKPGSTSTTTTTNNTTNTTIITTTTNYTTTHGTNAGSGTGKPDTGTGLTGGGGGTGGGDGSGTGASGGGDCKAPPVVTGDAALNMVANQAWATRCAVEAGNAAKVTGDIGNCKQPFSVEGTHANAVKLRAMRKQICPLEGEGDGDFNAGNGTGEGEPTGTDLVTQRGNGIEAFDQSGFGWSRTCPEMPSVDVFGYTVQIDANGVFCDWMTLGGWFVLLIAGLACLRILWSA